MESRAEGIRRIRDEWIAEHGVDPGAIAADVLLNLLNSVDDEVA